MKVLAITATCGRHQCIERSMQFFLDQDYPDCQQLIYQNSPTPQSLDGAVDHSKVLLVNQHLDSRTGLPYTSLGAIYNDAINFVPEDIDVICFWDDDDIFLNNHISEGMKGFQRGGKKAYKPMLSWYRNGSGLHKVKNTMEPSIFVLKEHVFQYGFSDTTTDQHLQWVIPLGSTDIYVDEEGPSTLCYNWGDQFYTYKTSGRAGADDNFDTYHKVSNDHGDGIITPLGRTKAEQYYRLFL